MSVLVCDSHKPIWVCSPRRERSCGCCSGEMCSKCRVVKLGGAEATVDGTRVRYNLKHGSVRVISPPKVLRYRSGTPTGATAPSEEWSGTLAQFQRVHSKGFFEACMMGWMQRWPRLRSVDNFAVIGVVRSL